MEWGALIQAVMGGGAAAQVATVALLLAIRRDLRHTQDRVSRLERYTWPEVFGPDS